MLKAITLLAAFSLVGAPALAADNPMITAEDPEGIASIMELAGYEVELDADRVGDPMIKTELAGWEARILFYGCDQETHDGCDSLQFFAGFDRAQPWNAEDALQLSSKYRFTSVWLDEDGDPFIQWDIITADGIPTKIFLRSLREFTQAITNVSEVVFAEENAEKVD